MAQPAFMSNMFGAQPTHGGPSGFKPKRKRAGSPEFDNEEQTSKHHRGVSYDSDALNAYGPTPDLIPDNSASASASDLMDHDMDFDMDMDMGGIHEEPVIATDSYSYAEGGSGGFGFGPGADEDEMDSDDDKAYPSMYPSFTAHSNPHHFSNNGGSSACAPYPLSAQPYSTTLRAPGQPGLMQPSQGFALPEDASAIERARNAHGPHCTSIPKLRMSDYPDASGHRSLWSVCQDCGACERAQV
ncbi:uncharacterized protein LOC62_01G000242 [Vanrija pseudolonga]|uniref:Uncharacterized protein n=1 Tax=Vanrija pseudolonga TaxID=143232 RepID=A0AAF1BEK8_9TREE|nr:hypothetical protein LOC62_01G000242 [Vanrija pseudolonga]